MDPANPILNVLKKIVMYLFVVVVLLGFTGNLIAFVTFSRKRFQNTVFSTYFRFLTFTDSTTLLLYSLFKFFQFEIDFNIRVLSVHSCRLFTIIAYAVPATSGWMTAVISLDRMISVKLPTKFKFRQSRLFQTAICLAVAVFNFVLYFQVYFSYIQTQELSDPGDNQALKFDVI